METIKVITGFTKTQMIYHFFENHKSGEYSTLYITNYLYQNFDLPLGKTILQLNNEVSSVLSGFYNARNTRSANFSRQKDTSVKIKKFLYQYMSGVNVIMPSVYMIEVDEKEEIAEIKPKQQTYIPKKKSNNNPAQLEFTYNEKLIDPIIEILYSQQTKNTMQEEKLSPLMTDIKNAEMLNTNDKDILQSLIEELIKQLPPNCQEIKFKKNVNDKPYSLILIEES